MTDETSKSIDAVRTFANYAIVLMHAWAAEQYVSLKGCEYDFWNCICNALTAAVLPGLFLVSGYLLARGFSTTSYPDKLVRRVKRLAVPYLVWNLTFVAFYLVVGRFVPRLGQRVATFGLDTWRGAIGKVVSFMTNPIDIPTWFMRTLFVYAVLAIVFYPLLKRMKGVLAYVALACWFAVTMAFGWGGRLEFTYPFYSIVCFVMGMHLSFAKRSPFEVFRSKIWFVVAFVGVAGLTWYRIRWHWAYSPVRDISFLMMLPLSFTFAPVLVKVASRLPAWEFIRGSSFFLYTGHFLFCSMTLHTLAPLFAGWTMPGKLTFLIVLFCTVGVAVNLLAYWIGKRLLGKAFGAWAGTL